MFFVFFAVLLSLSCFAGEPRHYRTTLRHIESGGIGYEDGYTTLEAFLASDPSRWAVTPFLDARGHVFDNGKWAANGGVGLRTLKKNRAYGINAYYDYRNAGRMHSNQIGVGLETLGELFDFRINGYLPVGAKTSAPYDSVFGSFSGHSLLVSQKVLSAMKGADAELGFHFGTSKSFDFYAAAGPCLEVSSCTIENSTTYALAASFSGNTSILLTNNLFLNNVNGVFLTLTGTSTLVCSNNTFQGQTSVSSVPFEIAASNNVFTSHVENNVFKNNTAGSIRLAFNNVLSANINVLNNTITNNGTGSQASLASSFVIIPEGTSNCSIAMNGNTFSNNTSNALYLHTSGAFTTLAVTASANTLSSNGGSALVLATPVNNTLTLLATGNTITTASDNGIAVIGSGTTSTGNITINNNTITNIGNGSNGIAVNQNFSTLSLTMDDNVINGCEGTGIISYASTGIGTLTLNASGNTISNCQNLSSNAASGLSIEQYTHLAGSITNNTLSGNVEPAVVVSSTLTSPSASACLTLTGNQNSSNYILGNSDAGVVNVSPCNVESVNTGTISTPGAGDFVISCPEAVPCGR